MYRFIHDHPAKFNCVLSLHNILSEFIELYYTCMSNNNIFMRIVPQITLHSDAVIAIELLNFLLITNLL